MELLFLNQFWDNIYKTFANIFSAIGQGIGENAVMAVITFALLLALMIYRSVRNRYTTEVTTYKAISKINDYLAKNPFITEDNLVEFNRLMMKAPKTIRFQWQRYIINRDKKPSDFLNEENCITRPLRTNSYAQGLKTFLNSTLALTIFSFVFTVASQIINLNNNVIGTIILSSIIPLITLFAGLLYMLFGKILYNAIMTDLYYSYSNFEKNIDRAVTNMPEAIDYEIIFTPKEIQNGIPALQEFLEQRAIYEQEQILKAKESEVEHEIYNFEELGVSGSLVMQRALKESEVYLGNRRRLLNEIENIKVDKESVTKAFDEENKDYQRNLRDIREELSSLKSKIEVVTNEITRSSLLRQQSAEEEKRQNVEKEIEKATKKYDDKIAKLNAEIEKRNKEIEESKLIAEKSLTDEFKHFSEKMEKDLKKEINKEVKDKIEELTLNRQDLEKELENKDKLMVEKLALYEDKINDYENLEKEIIENRFAIDELKNQISSLNQDVEDKNQEIFEVRQELESRKKEIVKKDDMIANFKKKKAVEVYRYFDANGNEFYFDDEDKAYYLDEDGNAVYYDADIQEEVNEEVFEEAANEAIEELQNEVSENLDDENGNQEKVVEENDEENNEGENESELENSEIKTTLNKLAKAAEESINKKSKSKKRKK